MPTHFAGTPDQRRALSAYIDLMRAAASVTAAVHGPIEVAGLTLPQFGVLEALHFVGPQRPQALAGRLLCTPGNMTVVLANLLRRGLIQRRRDPADGRASIVRLTPRGRALVRRLFPAHAARLTAALRPLTAAEQERLRSLCRRLGRGVAGGNRSRGRRVDEIVEI